jgi:hypothetical protein
VADRLPPLQIVTIIKNGKGRMPGFPKLSEDQMFALVGYLMSGESKELDSSGPPPAAMKYRLTGYKKFLDPDGYPAIAPPWGTLNAIDLNTGEYVWKVPLGEYPELAAKGMKNTGTENYGGPIVTAGGLLFIGATNFDKKFRAFDKSTGELLWETTLPFAGNATPATYEVNGRQFVVIAAGGGKNLKSPSGGVYVAFALPQEAVAIKRSRRTVESSSLLPVTFLDLALSTVRLLWPRRALAPRGKFRISLAFTDLRSDITNSSDIKNAVYPLPRARNFTSFVVWPSLASKLSGRFPHSRTSRSRSGGISCA